MRRLLATAVLSVACFGVAPAAADGTDSTAVAGNGSLTVENLAADALIVTGRAGLVPAGTQRIGWAGETGAGHVDIAVAPGSSHSVFLHTVAGQVAATVVTDALRHPGVDRVGVRLVNLGDIVLRLDLPAATPVPPRSAGPFLAVAPATGVRVGVPGKKPFDAVAADAAPGSVLSVVAVEGRDGAVRTVVTAAGTNLVPPTEPIRTGDEGSAWGALVAVAVLCLMSVLFLRRGRPVAVVAMAGLALTGCGTAYPAVSSPSGAGRPAPASARAPAPSVAEPVTLVWRGKDIPVRPTGLRGGEVVTVDDNRQAGWYGQSAKPGAQGTALVIAHDRWGGAPAAFTDLGAARPGDQAVVDRADGSRVTFVVDRVATVARTVLPTRFPELFRPTAVGVARLVLVTCAAGPAEEANVVVELSAAIP